MKGGIARFSSRAPPEAASPPAEEGKKEPQPDLLGGGFDLNDFGAGEQNDGEGGVFFMAEDGAPGGGGESFGAFESVDPEKSCSKDPSSETTTTSKKGQEEEQVPPAMQKTPGSHGISMFSKRSVAPTRSNDPKTPHAQQNSETTTKGNQRSIVTPASNGNGGGGGGIGGGGGRAPTKAAGALQFGACSVPNGTTPAITGTSQNTRSASQPNNSASSKEASANVANRAATATAAPSKAPTPAAAKTKEPIAVPTATKENVPTQGPSSVKPPVPAATSNPPPPALTGTDNGASARSSPTAVAVPPRPTAAVTPSARLEENTKGEAFADINEEYVGNLRDFQDLTVSYQEKLLDATITLDETISTLLKAQGESYDLADSLRAKKRTFESLLRKIIDS